MNVALKVKFPSSFVADLKKNIRQNGCFLLFCFVLIRQIQKGGLRRHLVKCFFKQVQSQG